MLKEAAVFGLLFVIVFCGRVAEAIKAKEKILGRGLLAHELVVCIKEAGHHYVIHFFIYSGYVIGSH